MRHLTLDGVTFGYEDVGKGAPPIVLVHDRGADHPSFAPQIEWLRRSHRVVAVDLPAPAPACGSERVDALVGLADGLARLLYELGVYLPILVGRGFGGRVALSLAERHPDLPAGVISVGSPNLGAAPPDTRRAGEGFGCEQLSLSELESDDQLSAAIEGFASRVWRVATKT